MDPAGPRPCASVQGTTLVVEDLFYNVNTRKQVRQVYKDFAAGTIPDCTQACRLSVRNKNSGAPACVQALKSSSDELSRILDIVGRYAIYKADAAFSCKRQVRMAALQCSVH